MTRDVGPADDHPGLTVRDISVSFGTTRVLDRLSMSVSAGEVVGLLGPSGSGKSTLLRVIAGIVAPDGGRVWVHGVDVTDRPTHRRGVGMVFQDNQLFPHLSVLDNVAFGPKMARAKRSERAEHASRWLRRVGLAGFEQRRVTDLSGGEAKRVALARTLAAEPEVVLLDEPLTGLDRALHDRLAIELGSLLHDARVTAVLVTHDPAEADVIADRNVHLADL